jgi:BlaI family transcriptional regulator, penicillinase repressor
VRKCRNLENMGKWLGLTESELELLAILWQIGPAPVAKIAEHFPEDRRRGHTTVQKLLQLMHQKGLVERDEEQRAHIYRPTALAEKARKSFAREMVSRVFGGSARALLVNAVGEDLTEAQIAEIERILNDAKKPAP